MSENVEKITGYNLKDFIDKILEKAAEGYQLSDTNQGFPQSWGPGLYTCDMVKSTSGSKETVKEPEPTVETVSESTDDGAKEDSTEDKPKTTRRTRRKTK